MKKEFKKLQDIIEKAYPISIKIRNINLSKDKNLKSFLINFFIIYNNEEDSIYDENNLIQTKLGKRRSLGDIYIICKYYYPNCTLEDIIKLLYIDIAKEVSGFRTNKCNQIHKRVWYYQKGNNNIADRDSKDEYNNNYNYYINILKEREPLKIIEDYIKDFNDILKLSNKLEIDILPYKEPKNKNERKLNNIAKLQIVEEVYAQGWIPDWNNSNEYKYYPYFRKVSCSWVVGIFSYVDGVISDGSLVYYKSSKQALDAGNKLLNIYIDIIENK